MNVLVSLMKFCPGHCAVVMHPQRMKEHSQGCCCEVSQERKHTK